jgi:hypothetical protein
MLATASQLLLVDFAPWWVQGVKTKPAWCDIVISGCSFPAGHTFQKEINSIGWFNNDIS